MTKLKFKSDAFEAIHSSAQALCKVGAINKTTLRDFDESCWYVPPDINSQLIKEIRKKTVLVSLCLRVILTSANRQCKSGGLVSSILAA